MGMETGMVCKYKNTGATTDTKTAKHQKPRSSFRSGEALKLSQLLRNYTLELLNFLSSAFYFRFFTPAIFHPLGWRRVKHLPGVSL